MKPKRIISAILAVILFVSAALFTSCDGTGGDASGKTAGGDLTGQAGDDGAIDSTEDAPKVMPSLETDSDEFKEKYDTLKAQQTPDGIGESDSPAELRPPDMSVFAAERERKYIDVEWRPVSYEAKVAGYKIKPDLSNVVNAGQFEGFTDKQLKMLSRNGFLVVPSKDEQLFYVYETNEYREIPSFITVDSVLQTYHVFYDFALRVLEQEYLLSDLEQLTDSMLRKTLILYDKLQDPEVKEAALKNAAYFAAAQLALEKELPSGMPEEAVSLAKAEYKLISDAAGFEASPIFGFMMDYSQYKPRGHYTRNHDFERYFKALMWYGQVPFPLLKESDGKKELAVPETLQALLITYSLFAGGSGTPDVDLWENIYDPTVFYVGTADDLTIYHYKDLIIKVYGTKPDPETFNDADKLAKLQEEAKKLPQPLIQAKWVKELSGIDTPVGVQFRFMGQRYIPDSEILQNLCEPLVRPVPKGLDVMAVLGSDRAYDLLTEVYDIDGQWEKYLEKFGEMKEKFDLLSDETWRSNLYYGWLWTLKTLTEPFGDGYPSFMTNQAWQDKSLNTALASWAELRHDTVLYGKPSGADEMGGWLPEESPKGYVEPNIGAYERLLWLTRYARENLDARNILPNDLRYRMEDFEELLRFLIDCSVKELRNEELTELEYEKIMFYGGTLESLTCSFADVGRWFEITSDTDKNMAVIADVHTAGNVGYLEEGVGYASHIFVIVPIGGKLYLTRGAVFSYYEFTSNKRISDEEWQAMLKEGRQPSLPGWTESFTDISGPLPEPDIKYVPSE